MKRTARIITTVAAMALTIVIMCVGIFAATKITFGSTSSTTISFEAKDVSATVTASKQMGDGAAAELTVPGGTADNGQFTPVFNQGQEYSGSIDIGEIKFTDVNATFTLTVTVENTFSANDIDVNAKYTVTCANANGYLAVETKVGGAAFTSGSTETVAKGTPVTFTTTIKIADDKKDSVLETGFSGETFSFSLELTRA